MDRRPTRRPSVRNARQVRSTQRPAQRPSDISIGRDGPRKRRTITPRRRTSRRWWLAGAAVVIVAVVAVALLAAGPLLAAPPSDAPVEEETPVKDPYGLLDVVPDEPIVVGTGTTTASGDGRLSFCAVGDNLISTALLASGDRAAGAVGDGAYDFHQLYAQVAPTIAENYDVAFVNQETVMAGADNDGFSGYPAFNSPDEVATALADGGFDVVVCNSNHSNDRGAEAFDHEIALWNSHPDVLTVGMGATPEQTQAIHIIERNGIRLAVLSYVYGINGYIINDEGVVVGNQTGNRLEGEGTFFNLITEDKLKRDIPRARAVADAVIVSIHCGDEYVHEPSDDQRTWAQLAADLGCDAVIGTHSHYIEPVEWIEGSGGNQTLVAWSLGDFVSGSNLMEASLGGMLSFDFVRDGDGVRIENPLWTPTVEHSENGIVSVRFLKDYTAEEAARNPLYTCYNFYDASAVTDIIGYARTLTSIVIGDAIPIAM